MTRRRIIFPALAYTISAIILSFNCPRLAAQQPPGPSMKQWEMQVRADLNRNAKLKALAAMHPLVLLHSRNMYCKGDYKQSAYSFKMGTSDSNLHGNDVQILFDNGGGVPNCFQCNMSVGQQNLVVDLGPTDFSKNPDLSKITIDHPGLGSWAKAIEGHVFLERIRDDRGSNFYVLFQVVSVDKGGRYMAFLWRKLPRR